MGIVSAMLAADKTSSQWPSFGYLGLAPRPFDRPTAKRPAEERCPLLGMLRAAASVIYGDLLLLSDAFEAHFRRPLIS